MGMLEQVPCSCVVPDWLWSGKHIDLLFVGNILYRILKGDH